MVHDYNTVAEPASFDVKTGADNTFLSISDAGLTVLGGISSPTITTLQTSVAQNAASIPDVSGFATTDQIPDVSGFATTDQIPDVSGFATTAEIPDVSGFATTAEIPDVSGFATTAELPTNVSELTNDSGYLTEVSYNDLTNKPLLFDGDYYSLSNTPDVSSMIATAVDGIVDGAPGTLDTLNEIAAAIADDANIATTLTTAIGTEASTARAAEQANATATAANTTAITAEVTRANAAEAALSTAVMTSDAKITQEETRATAAEAALQSNIDSLGGLSIAEVYIHNTSAGTGTGTYKNITTSLTRLSSNHRIQFVAPANGKVKLKFIGMFSGIDSSVGDEETGEEVYVAVHRREFAQAVGEYITDASGVVWDGNKFMQTDESGNHMQTIEINQDGLTPGETYTYEFLFKKGTDDTNVRLSFGADFAATVIRVETLPSNLEVKTS